MSELIGGPEQTDEEFEAGIERVREYKRANPTDRYVCFLLGSRAEDALPVEEGKPVIQAHIVSFGPRKPKLAPVTARVRHPEPSSPFSEGLRLKLGEEPSEPPATDPKP